MFALLILNYNGLLHLGDCLSSALVAIQRCDKRGSVVLVDNGSTDNSIEFTRRNFPEVEVVTAANHFLCSYNDVVKIRSEEILLFLNNDMRFDPEFIYPLISHLKNDETFASTARIMDWDGNINTCGQRRARIEKWWFYKWWDSQPDKACFTLDACGGAMAVSRLRFLALGGFDSMYLPGYYEDTDLSYRAWKRGWAVIYEPESIVFHKVGASFNKAQNIRRDALLCRNHILFTAKNIGNSSWALGFILALAWRYLQWKRNRDIAWMDGLKQALPLFPNAFAGRKAFSRQEVVTDEAIFQRLDLGF